MYLCLDCGNSRTKAAVFEPEGKVVSVNAFPPNEIDPIKPLLKEYQIRHAIISTTGKRDWKPEELGVTGKLIELDHLTPLPIEIIYRTPQTLGRDRIASACGSHAIFPGRNCLIVDAGTCITIDLVLKKGVFIGGNIAPGIRMRLEAMHEKTARLPLSEPNFPSIAFGDSTIHALQNGACLGAVMEIEGLFHRARTEYGDVLLVITGGDAAFLATRLEYQIFVEPELVLKGLFQILHWNVQLAP